MENQEKERIEDAITSISATFSKSVLTEIPIDRQMDAVSLATKLLHRQYETAIENAQNDLSKANEAYEIFKGAK